MGKNEYEERQKQPAMHRIHCSGEEKKSIPVCSTKEEDSELLLAT